MHARVTSSQVSPEKVDEAIKVYKETMHESKQVEGYKGELLLIDPETGRGIQITFYETPAHTKGAETSGHFDQHVGRAAHLITAPVNQEVFDVVVLEMPPSA